ncbi:MAG TPA: hypothetical protein VHD35_12155 [Chitinophagaceae bacterium]|nr:hypothetical protein [Chitinophagaceae bacterium]
MQWESINSITGQREYVLWHHDKKALTLTFHPSTNSARVESPREKRVFLIRNEGFLRNRTVMRTEYGILLGQLRFENKENFIEINNEKFFYIVRNNLLPEVVIYKESKEDPFTVCSLNIDAAHFTKNKNLPASLESGLLLSLCWYLMLPAVKEKTPKMAV